MQDDCPTLVCEKEIVVLMKNCRWTTSCEEETIMLMWKLLVVVGLVVRKEWSLHTEHEAGHRESPDPKSLRL